MDKKVASQIVSDTFNASFKKEEFVYFIKNLLNHIEEVPFVYRGNYIPDAYNKYINTLERIGKYTDGENKIDILVVNLKKENLIERARSMQRNFIAWYLNGSRGGELKDAALVAFVSPNQEDWRFSLVKMDYKFEEKKDGRVKVKEVFTPARRWSFLVGKNENSHTAKSRLAPIICDDEHNPTLKELEDAFNIEKVTKEFFEKYRELFLWAKESFDKIVKEDDSVQKDFEAKEVNTVDFTKKLLGQIVFLYFLQKKGWFGVERDANWGTGPKNFLRELFEGKHGKYKNFFNDILEPLFYEALAREREDNFYSRFNCKIPFLNGGLFDPINNYDWVHTDIILPNELFSNEYKTKEGDIGNGILDIFDRYNFTVKEDEPLEKEVAVDPEMLGKVFENLLEVKDRKSKGTYYTPREIVHYMCEQSLLNYLSTELEDKVKREEIEKLIKYGESVIENEIHTEKNGKETKKYSYKLPESIRKNAKLIDEKLTDIKVCDPAVGSGAFPVGMMAEIIRTRSVLSTYIKDKSRTIYNFKRYCIESSLYGVDIDLGAVEIAKLRLWLSLVVDEEDIKTIKPLPNLDYKIVCGNSLLGVEKNLFNQQSFAKLEELKHLFFNETDTSKKREHKKQIDEIIEKVTNRHRDFDFEIYFSEVFHSNKGFDIIIANPPYISHYSKQSQKLEKIIEEHLRRNYEFLDKSSDKTRINSVMFFLEKGFKILKQGGVLSYIMDLNILENPFIDIRKYITQKMSILEIIKGLTVFENVGSGQVILITQKLVVPNFVKIKSNLEDPGKIINQQDFIKEPNCSWESKDDVDILHKIELDTTPLEKLTVIHTGVAVYATNEGRDNFIKNENVKNCYPLLTGGDSIKFSYCLPVVKKYILYDKKLEEELNNNFDKKYFRKNGSHQRPFNLRRIEEYDRPKIVIRQSDIKLTATYVEDLLFGNYSLFNVYSATNNTNLLKFILGVINSSLLSYYAQAKNIILSKPGKTPQIRSGQRGPIGIRQIPIKKASLKEEQNFTAIVDKILSITKSKDYLVNPKKQTKVKKYEHQIDQMVYELYGLTLEEIKIVENYTKN